MQQEEIKKSKKLFHKKTINFSNDYSELTFDIKQLLKKNEEVIINYLERFIYTSSLSQNTKDEIQIIFDTIDTTILNNTQ